MKRATLKIKKLFTFHSSLISVSKLFNFYNSLLTISLFTFIFSLFTFHCFAQQQYNITNYAQEQGLAFGAIRGIYKDTTGYLWLTSEGGAARFDGYNFKTFRYNPDVSNSLPKDFSWNAALPKFGDIYFGTDHGFCLFNPASQSFTYRLPCGDSIKVFHIDEREGVKDGYWLTSKFAILRVSKNGSERFALPVAINTNWRMIPSPGNDVMLYNYVSKDSLLFFDYQSRMFSKPKITDRMGMEDSSSIMEVIFNANNYYLFTAKSLYRFDSTAKSFVWHLDLKHTNNFNYDFQPYLSFNDTLVVIRSKSGYLNLFNIRTGQEKLIYLNKKIPESELNDKGIYAIANDNNGSLWMGTNAMGLIHYNVFTGELEQYIHDPGNLNSIPNNFIYYVLTDENGVVWAGCFGHGLIKMEPVKAVFKTAIPDVASRKIGANSSAQGGWSQNIRGFVETDDGYWIATLDGLFSYSKQTQQFSNITYLCPVVAKDNNAHYADAPSAHSFGSLTKDHAGNLWIGPWYGELVLYNPTLNRTFPFHNSRPLRYRDIGGWFRNLFCDSKNRMWLSTQNAGLCMIDCNVLTLEKTNETKFDYHFFDEKDSISFNMRITFVVAEDADGTIWAGTEFGLFKYNEQTKKWKQYVNIPGNQNSIHNSNVRSICLDKNGTLWIGTNGGGLNRYNKKLDNFTHFTTENGLADDQIYTLICDDNGMLWMGTNHGLCRFNPQNYSCKNFTEKDGIQNYEYNTNAALKLKDGTLLFGGVSGYNIIDPDKIENKKSKPPVVVISSFKVFDKETPLQNHFITLNHKENNLAFEFAALSYYRNQENHYAYMLEPIDHDWIFSDNRRYVSYPKLEPGDYTFKVKACNSDGVWNETGTQMQITINAPWWKQTWFVILCFVIGVIIIYLLYRMRNNRRKQMEAVRARISRDLHDDMGSTLQSISVMSEIARMKTQSTSPESIPIIEKIGSASRDMVEKMNDIVWAVNPKNDNFENIILHMRAFGGELLAGKDIALHFKADSGLNSIVLTMEKRKSFFLVYKEALNNAYKYSGAKNVKVEISKSNHSLKLIVEDDGVGFNMNEDRLKTGGNGLKNMNTRAAELNGNISITSEPGRGTTVSLAVKLS